MGESASAAELTELLVPEEALRRWIGDSLPGEGPFSLTRVTTGHSNELFALERGGHSWLLRRPPRVANAPGAHDMAREHRILAALDGTDVPHAKPVLFCEDPEVIGAPFFVMEKIDGVALYDSIPEAISGPDQRRRVGEELFDTLASLHNVDWNGIGLGDLGRPDGFTERQVPRWMKQLASYQTRPLPDLEEAGRLLEASVPTMQRAALIHGDYGLHNVLFRASEPVELLAVLDWETATIGDPLMDLGYLLGLWLEGDEPQRWTSTALPYPIDGYPPRRDMALRYAERTGLDLSEIQWYRAVAQLRIACILEGAYTRYARGDADDPFLARLGEMVPNHAAYSLAIIRGEA